MCNNRTTGNRLTKWVRASIGLCFLLFSAGQVFGQHAKDTIQVIHDFNDVMAFAVQPYVYYSSTTLMTGGQSHDGRDSVIRLKGKFYKLEDDMYYSAGEEELFLQDSTMVHIDHKRKAITIQHIDMATKKNIDLLPLKKIDKQRLLRGHYLISEAPSGADTGVIVIRARQGRLVSQLSSAEMRVEYRKDNHLPLLMQLTVKINRAGSDQNEMAAVRFDEISMQKDQAQHMPLWRDKVTYDQDAGLYNGVGDCAGYAVIKM